jgi:hypothetical protein
MIEDDHPGTLTIENRGRSTINEFEGLLEIPPGGSQDLVLKVNLPGNMLPLTSRQCST